VEIDPIMTCPPKTDPDTMLVFGHIIAGKQEEAAELMDDLMAPINVTNCTIFAPGAPKNPENGDSQGFYESNL